MQHEYVNIPPFQRLPVESLGSLGYVCGNLPYIAYYDGNDAMRLPMGAVLPITGRHVELWNPFSIAARVQIMRGGQLANPGNGVFSYPYEGELLTSRGGLVMAASGTALRRGVIFRVKRGVYSLAVSASGGNADDFRLDILTHVDDGAEALRPVGFVLADQTAMRNDGSINGQCIVRSGTWGAGDFTAWATAGGANVQNRQIFQPFQGPTGQNSAMSLTLDSETLLAFSTSHTSVLRYDWALRELGDMTSGIRGA